MRFPHWQYFLSLEKDFVKTIEYVELDPSNESTFSAFQYLSHSMSLEKGHLLNLVQFNNKTICRQKTEDMMADLLINEDLNLYPVPNDGFTMQYS